MQKKFKWQLRGMMQDMSEANQSAQYATNAVNVRFNVDDQSNQLMSATSEEAPWKSTYQHAVVGTIVLPDNKVMFFTTDGIYVDNTNIDSFSFDENTPVEALCYVESDNLWKIYINDAVNEPRYIVYKNGLFSKSLPFSIEIGPKSVSKIEVERIESQAPLFPTGSIQYAYRIYENNGAATGLIGLSQLQYITGDPSVNQQVAFTVRIPGIEKMSDLHDLYIQLYSIHRATQYAQPEVKLIYEGLWHKDTRFTDTNVGAIVDSTEPLFFGCKKITAESFEISGNKLFVGGYAISNDNPIFTKGAIEPILVNHTEYKTHKDVMPYFKKGENYRLGVQFMDKSGNWSTVQFVDNVDQTQGIEYSNDVWKTPAYKMTGHTSNQYVAARPVVVYPDGNDRQVVAQTLMSPSITKYKDGTKDTNEFDYASDWFFRTNYKKAKDYDHIDELNPQLDGAATDLYTFKNTRDCFSMYSPEFEYGNTTINSMHKIVPLRYSVPSTTYIERMITTSTPLKPIYRSGQEDKAWYGLGFIGTNKQSYGRDDIRRYNNPKSDYIWQDGVNETVATADYLVAPWQCDGALCIDSNSNNPPYSLLRYNQTAIYMTDDSILNNLDITDNVNGYIRTVEDGGLYSIGNKVYSAGINTSIQMPRAQYKWHYHGTTADASVDKENAILNINYGTVRHAACVVSGLLDVGGLVVADIVREFSPAQKARRFGGSNDEALMSNHWDIAGHPASVDDNGQFTITWEWGDTFIGKYDILKSYSPTTAVNQVVSIYSVLLESRINMNNRYDNNVNKHYFIGYTDENFQKINNSANTTTTYSNAIFAKPSDNSYSSSISWSLTKHGGEIIDPFLQLSLDASMNLDGQYGKCRSVYTFNNQLLAFQDKAVNLIHYNERTILTAQNGVPVTIANQAAVDGFTTISNNVGCMNKFSITDCNAGLFFVDQYNKAFIRFDGKSFVDLGLQYGMKSWENTYIDQTDRRDWYVTAYDRDVNDVIFTMKTDYDEDRCMVFNTQLNCFTSQYDYLRCVNSYYYNGKMHFVYDFKDYTLRGDVMNSMPCSISFIANANEISDMIFDHLEVVSDRWEPSDGWNYVPLKTFDAIGARTQYQSSYGEVKSPLMKKKFNVFRINIPRCTAQHARIPDRIRGPWAEFTLSTVDTTDKIKLSMLQATYSV